MKKRKMKEMVERENERKGKEGDAYIKMENIHFNPPGKFVFKSNSFLAI